MSKGQIIRKKSVLRMWVASYLAVLILPLSISVLLYWTSWSVTKRNTETINRAALEQTEASISRIFTDTRSLGMQIFSQQEVVSLAYATIPLNVVKREKVGSLQDNLRERIVYSDYITDIYIYFSHLGMAASTKGLLDKQAFNRELQNNLYTDIDAFSQWTMNGSSYQVVLLGDASAGAQGQKLAVVINNPSNNSTTDVTCVVAIDPRAIRELLAAYGEEGEQYVWIIDPSQNLLISQTGLEEMALAVSAAVLQGEEGQMRYGGENLMVTSLISGNTGWTLVSAIPMNQYAKEMELIQQVYLVFLVICIGVGIVISILFARRNYSPVKRLSHIIAETKVEDSHNGQGEFAYLEQSLLALMEKKQDYEREIDRQRRMLKQNSLVRMLRGTLHTDSAFETACADYGITFTTDQFLVVGVMIRDYSSLFYEDSDINHEDEESAQLVYFIVSSVMEELVGEKYNGYMCENGDNYYCIVSPKEMILPEQMPLMMEDLKRICRHVEVFVRERFAIYTAYYVSDLYSGKPMGAKGIHDAFEEVQWGFEQVEGFHLPDLVLCRKELMNNVVDASSPMALLSGGTRRKHFSNAVASGNLDAADELYEALLQEGIGQVDQAFVPRRFHSVFLIDYLLSNMDSGQVESCANEIQDLLQRIMKAKNMKQLKELMHQSFALLHGTYCQPSESAPPLGNEIAEYIDQNFNEPGLSVSLIAEHFGLSQSYLLRVFKKGMGSGVLDYIHQRRVDEAKALLKNSSGTVSEIAEQVGYSNALALIRAFKRLEGITPSVYRNMSGQA